MNINIIAVGKMKEDFLKKACAEFEKRLSRFCKLNIIEVSGRIFYGQSGT